MTKRVSIGPTTDWLFKRIFGDERHLSSLRAFLLAVLDLEVSELEDFSLVDPHLRKEDVSDKFGVLDVRIRTRAGKSINVEVQVAKEPFLPERIVYYLAKMVSEQMSAGDEYEHIKKVISIIILDYELLEKSSAYHHVFRLQDRAISFGDILEVHTLELPKLPVCDDGTKLWDWLAYFRAKDKHEMQAVAKRDREVAKVVSAYLELTENERAKLEADYHEKARKDKAWLLGNARRAGLAEGLTQGLAQGEKRKALTVARNALALGLDHATVSQLTGLSVEEISQL